MGVSNVLMYIDLFGVIVTQALDATKTHLNFQGYLSGNRWLMGRPYE